MAAISLHIDGREVTARRGETLLETARANGIDIPTLCSLDGLPPWGGCRLCLVEIDGEARPQPACLTAARPGQVVRTATPQLVEWRRMIVELLLAERNHVCAVCTANQRCELQTLAARLGVDHVRYDYLHPALAMDASQARFALDHNRCILCTRCVRTCATIEGACTLGVGGRGLTSRVVVDLDRRWGESRSCTDCGKCVRMCPTGALFSKDALPGAAPPERGPVLKALARRRRGGR